MAEVLQNQCMKRREAGSYEQQIGTLLDLLFAKDQFNAKAFFPLFNRLSEDTQLVQPSCIIFALYNLFLREDSGQTIKNCLKKVELSGPPSVAHVAALTVRSAFEAYNKNYHESLNTLRQAYELGKSAELVKDDVDFYHRLIAKLIEIHDLSTFRREYLALIEKILEEQQESNPNALFIQSLEIRAAQLREKVCLTKHRPRRQIGGSHASSKSKQPSNAGGNPYSDDAYGDLSKDRQKSSYSRSSSNRKLNTVNSKRSFKKYQHLNPYQFTVPEKNDQCAFM